MGGGVRGLKLHVIKLSQGHCIKRLTPALAFSCRSPETFFDVLPSYLNPDGCRKKDGSTGSCTRGPTGLTGRSKESTDHNNNIKMTSEDLLQPGHVVKERWKVVRFSVNISQMPKYFFKKNSRTECAGIVTKQFFCCNFEIFLYFFCNRMVFIYKFEKLFRLFC